MQKWPFWLNLSHFFGQICNCGSFSATLVWNDLKKLENSKNLLMYPPQKWKFLRFLQKWDALVAKDGKSCESGEIDHSQSISAHFGEKIEKYAKMAILTQSKPLFWPNLQLWVIFSRIGVNDLKKLENSKICQCTLPPPRNENFWDFSKNDWWQKKKLWIVVIWLQKMCPPKLTKFG